MNILYLCDEYPPGRHGGIGTVVKMLANEVAELGHNVYVAGLYDWGYSGDDFFMDGKVHVFRFRMRLSSKWFHNQDSIRVRGTYKLLKITGLLQKDVRSSLSRYESEINKLIQEKNIDIIERPDFNDYMRYCKTYIKPLKFDVPTVVKIHGSLTYIFKENNDKLPEHVFQMESEILNDADAIVSVSKFGAEKVKKYFSYSRDIEVIPNGIETTFFYSANEKESNKVVFTGTLNKNKGIYQLMQAWNIVAANDRNALLEIYGKGPVEKLQILLDDEYKHTVIFKGHVSRKEIVDVMAHVGIAIFPSYAENFALAPMEAMAAGAAVIYTKRTSGPELINDGIDGLLVDPDDIETIAASILSLLKDKAYCKKIAGEGRKKIITKYDISVIAKESVEFYKRVINEHQGT